VCNISSVHFISIEENKMISFNKKKTQRGFTLVEVIVVAIIVAALAAVAIPIYTSYVTNSRNNSAANAAGSVASFMGACINQTGTVTALPVLPHAGTANTTLTCSVGNTTMQLPIGIGITISSLTGTGTVTATHTASGSTAQTYNY
jgi:prepilin-type N-terminal cleavage/methylation domain-containing protein